MVPLLTVEFFFLGLAPWAVSADDAAVYMLESALGSYSSDILQGWDVPQSVDWDSAADGSLVRDEVSGSAWAGAGVYARLHGDNWRYRRLGHFDDLGLTPGGLSSSCLGFCSLPGPLQTVQRAEFWGVVPALQATNAVHLGVDNLNVVWHVCRLLNDLSCVRPLELVDDGDLIILIRKLLSIRGEGTVCISKVKGHADEDLVRSGQVRALDRYGNSCADEAADFGRRRVWPDVADARRNLSGVCRLWYLVVLLLHRFFFAMSRAVVNCDDSSGLAHHPLVWSAGAVLLMSFGMLLCFLVLFIFGILVGLVFLLLLLLLRLSVFGRTLLIFLIKLVTVLGSLHWPSAGNDMGPGGVSYAELLILYELWAGERLQFERLFLGVRELIAQFQCRLFLLVQALIFGDLVSFLVLCCVRYVVCLVVWVRFFLLLLVPITAGYGISVGLSLVMVSLPGLVRLLIIGSLMTCFFFLVTLLGLGVLCCVGLCL